MQSPEHQDLSENATNRDFQRLEMLLEFSRLIEYSDPSWQSRDKAGLDKSAFVIDY